MNQFEYKCRFENTLECRWYSIRIYPGEGSERNTHAVRRPNFDATNCDLLIVRDEPCLIFSIIKYDSKNYTCFVIVIIIINPSSFFYLQIRALKLREYKEKLFKWNLKIPMMCAKSLKISWKKVKFKNLKGRFLVWI